MSQQLDRQWKSNEGENKMRTAPGVQVSAGSAREDKDAAQPGQRVDERTGCDDEAAPPGQGRSAGTLAQKPTLHGVYTYSDYTLSLLHNVYEIPVETT